MSLRARLFLLIGGLAAALVVAQWWLVRTLTRDVTAEVSQVAIRVGEGVVTSLGMLGGPSILPEGAKPRSPAGAEPSADSKGVSGPDAAVPRRFELPIAPLPEGTRTVTERQIRLQERDGKLEIVDERVRVGHVQDLPKGELEWQGSAELPAGAAAAAHGQNIVVMLSVGSAERAKFLRLGGPSDERHVPIPIAGVDEALESFRKRLLAGSAALLAVGLALAGAIAHRATAPLRELGAAARSVGEGALGTQVPHPGGGEVGQAVAAFNSMSRRLAELDAESRRLREREHLTEVGEIARGLAHGLRNPLNALGLTIDELAASAGTTSPLAEAARRQVRRIDQAIRSFLALAATATSLPEEDVDLVGLVQDVALEALQDARGRVGVGVDAADGLPPVRGVPAELRAVAQALVVNAVEASPDGGRVQVRVEAAGATDHGAVRLVVEDDGPGLPETVREKLFTPHVTTKASGSGMGLYLAHRVVTARHGGTLAIEPRVPRGTRATATFPARSTEA